MDFTELPDLAAARLGGRAVLANDEFFAPRGEPPEAGPGHLHSWQVHGARQVDGRLGDAPPPRALATTGAS